MYSIKIIRLRFEKKCMESTTKIEGFQRHLPEVTYKTLDTSGKWPIPLICEIPNVITSFKVK